MKKLYYKNKLINLLIKPFENKRLFSPLKLKILTLKDYNLWPEKVIALDTFSQTGLQWTKIFASETHYLEMWEINEEAVKYARKEFPNAKVIQGDTISAFRNQSFGRKDFNFIVIDNPVPFQFDDNSFEHYGFFDSLFKIIADKAIVIFNAIPYLHNILKAHPCDQKFIDKWAEARKIFYSHPDGISINPDYLLNVYRTKINQSGYSIDYLSYDARNQYWGMVTMVLTKKIN